MHSTVKTQVVDDVIGILQTNPSGSLTIPHELHNFEGMVIITAHQTYLDLRNVRGACILCGDVAYTYFWGRGVCKTCRMMITNVDI